ncbi:MAG: sugar ABC transporter substrate-binding protein [Lautropia sp.]|nr:sugar ABC transporter substrate-binding protein [Lautropia sp.]
MKRLAIAAALLGALAGPAQAENIGITISMFDDNNLTRLRNQMKAHVKDMKDVKLQFEDAQMDVGKQLNQVQNFVASGVDAIIVNPVDTDATMAMTKAAEDAGIPLVYVNHEPVNLKKLPETQAYVGSDEKESGTLQTQEVCRLLKEKGKDKDGAKVVVMMGELQAHAARVRTQDIKDVIARPECSFMKIVESQTALWMRTPATDLMTNWLSAGVEFDAVISNNDEMALGAVQAMKAGGMDMDDVIVAGIDGTSDALAAMKQGDIDVTVFQNTEGQADGSIDAALNLARGKKVESINYIPFELVTMDKVAAYQARYQQKK